MVWAQVAFDRRELQQLQQRIANTPPATLVTSQIEIEQGDLGNAQALQQAPEVVDVPAAQRHHAHRHFVLGQAFGAQQPRQHDLLAVAFPKDHEPREVQLGKRLHGLAHELVGLIGRFRHGDH